jgi:hypothetical protein
VNAACVLLMTAGLTSWGDTAPATKPAAPAAPVVASAGCGCDSCCDSCCDSGHGGWLGKLRGRFHRDDCCASSCDSCGHSARIASSHDCGCNDGCDECGWGARFKAKFRGWFHRDCGCSDCGGCSGCGGCGTAAAPMSAPVPGKAEQIPAPKGGGTTPAKPLPQGTTSLPTLRPVPAVTASSRIIVEQ